MERNFAEQARLESAKKKVKDIKGFYIHLTVYLFINAAIIIFTSRNSIFGEGSLKIENFFTLFFWGIGLFSHWASVFGSNLLFGKNWEDRKTKELMQKQNQKTQEWE